MSEPRKYAKDIMRRIIAQCRLGRCVDPKIGESAVITAKLKRSIVFKRFKPTCLEPMPNVKISSLSDWFTVSMLNDAATFCIADAVLCGPVGETVFIVAKALKINFAEADLFLVRLATGEFSFVRSSDLDIPGYKPEQNTLNSCKDAEYIHETEDELPVPVYVPKQ